MDCHGGCAIFDRVSARHHHGPSGAVAPSASITVSNKNGYSKTVSSGADGNFNLEHLVPGRYSLSITATGFAGVSIPDIAVYSGKTTSKDVKLQIESSR